VNAIGIMQGRLSPAPPGRAQRFPWSSWRDEFTLAGECGFDHLEWLVTAERMELNPLWTGDGVDAIARQAGATGVTVSSVCADCFITQPLVRVPDVERQAGLRRLEHLIAQASRLGAGVILVPLLEDGAIGERDEGTSLIDAMAGAFEQAARAGVRIGLETDLPAHELTRLIDRAGGAAGAYYDLGNAAARGADAVTEIAMLGSRLCGVHIKDRPRAGASVSLGSGEVDFRACLRALAGVGYDGPLVLETPAGASPLSAARTNLTFLRALLDAPLATQS
jgi:L-ribulose-5-phosphate 3-epimerase